MNRQYALDILGDGHSVWSVEAAKEVCENVGVPWSDSIAAPHYSVYDRGKYNIYMQEEGEITVMCQDLTDYVMDQLGVQPEHFYHGRGTQAKDNSEVIAKELERRSAVKTKTTLTDKLQRMHPELTERLKKTITKSS